MDTKPPIDIADVSGASYGERLIHYSATVMKPDAITQEGIDLAHRMATEEMMNEHHTMLMAICEKLGIKVG